MFTTHEICILCIYVDYLLGKTFETDRAGVEIVTC